MKKIVVICSIVVAVAIIFGCLFGFGVFHASLPVTEVNRVETLTDVTAAPETSTVPNESPTNTVSSKLSSVVSKQEEASRDSSVASSKPVSSNKTSSTVSAPVSSSVSTAFSSTVKKPTVTVKKETNQTDIVNYIKRPTYSSVQKEIKALAKKYPDLISVSSIGKSVQNRDLTLLKVGNGDVKALIVGGIHARESITVSYVMRCVEEFCAAYESKKGKFANFDMVNLLKNYTLYIVPLSNPDGLEIISGRAKPSVKINYRGDMTLADYKGNANGVNLNKNFPLLWDKINSKVTLPDPEGYKGPSAASEPETKALMKLCENNDFAWMNSIHVRGDCVYWSDSLNPSVGASETIVNVLKERCDFYKCPTSEDVNGFGGGFENWFRKQYKKPGFCVELMPLDIKVTPLSNSNHASFSNTVRWNVTKKLFPLMMVYGFPG